jgi:hypothetical protein
MYNSGEDPRLYMLDQYVRKYGNMKDGLPNRGDYRAKGSKNSEFDNLYSQYGSKIDALPLEERIGLLDAGRDFYYKGINNVNGAPSPAYEATWKPRMGMFGAYQSTPSAPVNPSSKTTYTLNGRSLDINNPADAAIIKQQEAGIADDQAAIAAHYAQKAPRAMGQTISAQDFRTPPMAPTSIPQGPNWGNAIPVVNTRAAIYNNLMGIQPQVSSINQPNNFPNLKEAPGMSFMWGQQPSAGMIPLQPITRPDEPKQYAVDNTSGKDLAAANTMISQDAKNLQNTFNTGSAKDTKAGIANFNSTYGTNLKDPRLIKFGAKGRATAGAIGDASQALQAGITVADNFTSYLDNKKKQREFNSYLRDTEISEFMNSEVQSFKTFCQSLQRKKLM